MTDSELSQAKDSREGQAHVIGCEMCSGVPGVRGDGSMATCSNPDCNTRSTE